MGLSASATLKAHSEVKSYWAHRAKLGRRCEPRRCVDREDLERIDLTALIQSYLNNLNVVHPEAHFIFQGTTSPFMSWSAISVSSSC